MSNILIAQIGRGNYQKTKYLSGDRIKSSSDFEKSSSIFETGYTFEATMNEICNGDKSKTNHVDHVVLIGTETSHFGMLLYYYYCKSIDRNREIEITEESYDCFKNLLELAALKDDMELKSFAKDNKKIYSIELKNIKTHLDMLQELLTTYISCVTGNKNLKVKLVVIQYGMTSGELEYNFDTLRKSVEEIIDYEEKNEHNIYFDISNGFRSLPMYIYTFMNYLLRIRDEKFKLHMYYGMADGKQGGVAPIVNLENINGMMDWINAANEFHNYGSVRQLERQLNDNPDLHTLFQQFDYASNANNLGVLRTTIENIIKLKDVECFEKLPYYAKPLLRKIGQEFHEEFDQEKCNLGLKGTSYSYAYLTIHLANWYMRQGRTGNAAIALQEGITTFMMERWPEETDLLISGKQKQTHGHYFEQDSIKWLFDFENRDVISRLFKTAIPDLENKVESGAELTLVEKMCVIRNYIRNPEAHILINQISDSLIEKSQKILEEMIKWMCELMSDRVNQADEEQLFRQLASNQQPLQEDIKACVKLYFNEIKDLSRTVHTIEMDDSEVWKAAETLENELKFLKDCQIASLTSENEKVRKFQTGISSKKYLSKFLEKWLEYTPEDHEKNPAYSKEACRKLLKKNKKNRTTEERVIGWISTHGDVVFEIITMDMN